MISIATMVLTMSWIVLHYADGSLLLSVTLNCYSGPLFISILLQHVENN